MEYAGTTAPGGWLICDGSTVSICDYRELYNVIGPVYTGGFGIPVPTEFSLPDLRGRTVIGAGQGEGLSLRGLGHSAGVEGVALTIANMPSHTHAGTTVSAGAHVHGVNDPGHSHGSNSSSNLGFVKITGNNTPDGLDNSANEIDNTSITALTINTAYTGITIAEAGAHTHFCHCCCR